MTTRKALPDGTSDGSDGQIFTRPTLCSHNHAALKRDETAWQAAGFAGYQPLGRQLGEARHCPRCQSTVVRLVAFTKALTHVIESLTDPPVSELYLHSATMLASWARENIPSDLGIADDPTEPPTSPPTAAAATADLRQLGQTLREQREEAGLSRRRLATLAGVADSTIRNVETGRHRPHGRTIQRLRWAVQRSRRALFSIQPAQLAS